MNEDSLKVTCFQTIPLQALPVSEIIFEEFLTPFEKEILKKVKMVPHKDPHHPFISESYDVLNDLKLTNLISKFDQCVDLYTSNVLEFPFKLKMVGSWLTKNTTDTFHGVHTHSNSFISVVAYFGDYDKEEAAGIQFSTGGLNKVFDFNFNFYNKNLQPTNWNIFNNLSYTIKAKKNQVIIFPAQLPHGSEVCDTEERFCVGANYFISGTLGTVEDKNLLKL